MSAKKIYHYSLLIIASIVIYYILTAGFNLIFKLAVPNKPNCEPLFCKEIISENTNCLIKTPGFAECVDIEGYFYVLSMPWAYSLLALSLALAFYFSKRFYLSRIFAVLFTLALLIFIVRLLLGAIELSFEGLNTEFNKLGLNQPFIQQFGETLFQMVNPKL